MPEADRPPRLQLHLHLAADTTLATALAAAGLTARGPVGTAEVWVTTDDVWVSTDDAPTEVRP